jgi:hypothetical protein
MSLVEPGKPSYPAFTGTEACASIGNEHFCTEERDFSHYETLRNVCATCPLLVSCFNWALHNEDFHYWGGSSAHDRKHIRRIYNIERKRSIAA